MIVLKSEVPNPNIEENKVLGWLFCHLWFSNLVLFYFFVLSTFNLLLLTMERYFAIVHPFKYQAAFYTWPRLKVCMSFVLCWVFSGVLKFYNMLIFKAVGGKCTPNLIPGSKIIGVLTAILQYILPVAVMLFAYIRISVEMKRGAARVGPAPAQHISGGANAPDMAESLLRARRSTFKMLLIVFVTFLICWTPNELIFFMFNVGWLDLEFNEWYYLLSVAMVATNCCANPVIYAFKYRQFRSGLKELFCLCRKSRPNLDSSYIATGGYPTQLQEDIQTT